MLYSDNEALFNGPDVKRFKRDSGVIKGNLSFVISSEERVKDKIPQKNQVSHRIAEKRRRDRMNTCLVDLCKLIPTDYLKQGQRRMDKTEIIEMAIKLIQNLQTKKNEPSQGQDPMCLTPLGENAKPCCISKFYMGFKECQDEVMRFLVETEDNNTSDQVCVCMMDYLGKAAKKFMPTTGRVNMDVDNNKMFSNPKLTSSHSLQSISPVLADIASSSESSHQKNRSITSDSGFTNTDSAFSSISLPLHKSRTDDRNTHLDNTVGYERANSSGSCAQSSYKFKHSITKRFSQEQVKQQQHSDSSSSSSKDEQSLKAARRSILKTMLSNYSLGSTAYPCSSNDGYNQSNLHSSINSAGEQAVQGQDVNVNMYLPGFVLHPTGSHYFPVSIHPMNVPQSFAKNEGNEPVIYHPISIPVWLNGPRIEIKGSQVLA